MARKRSIKPRYVESAAIEKLSFGARYLDQNLWCHLDGNGMIEDSVSLIKAKVFPKDGEKISTGAITKLIQELVSGGRVFNLKVDGKNWLYRKDFRSEQRIYKDEFKNCQIDPAILDDLDKGNTRPTETCDLFTAYAGVHLPSASSSSFSSTSTSPSSSENLNFGDKNGDKSGTLPQSIPPSGFWSNIYKKLKGSSLSEEIA